MTPDDEATAAAELFLELAGRVREYPPDANSRWLAALPTERRDQMLILAAIAFPIDHSWGERTAWARGDEHLIDTPHLCSKRRRDLLEALPETRGFAHPSRRGAA